MPVQRREPDLGKVHAGVPHQRAIAVDPQAVAQVEAAERGLAGGFDLPVRPAPVGRPPLGPGAFVPERQHLRRDAQSGLFGRCQLVAQSGQVPERVVRQRVHLITPA
jgi:hypothetical protein